MKLALLIAWLLVGLDSDWLLSTDPTEASDVMKMDGGDQPPKP